jgi:hypothetical protein
MKVKEANSFGNLSEEELNDFEDTNQKTLPVAYRNFLLENNGGIPLNQNNQVPKTIVEYIFGMHNGDYYASLYKNIDIYKNRLPLMSLNAENYGQIFFWDHEGESKKQDGHYTDNVSFVAYSFAEFIGDLS